MKHTNLAGVLVCALLLGGCTNTVRAQSPGEVPLDEMRVARTSGKPSVPVEVRYHVGAASPHQTTTLQLAFVPRVAGENLTVEFPTSDSATVDAGKAAFRQQKAAASNAIRRSALVTPTRSGDARVRVLVSMDVAGARFFGVFSIPLDGSSATKADGETKPRE
jgi:hypothetical protein